MLDRIDLHIEVPRVEHDKLSDKRIGEPSALIRERIESARENQLARFSQRDTESGMLTCNADMRASHVRQSCELDDASNQLMRSAMRQMQLSARAYHRMLKLAHTIADLADEQTITPQHLAEALQYRPKLGID